MNKYKIEKGFINQRILGKIVIFDLEESMTYTFNEVGSFIFEKMKNGKSKEGIVAKLTKEFIVSEEVANEHFDEFLQKLLSLNIISR